MLFYVSFYPVVFYYDGTTDVTRTWHFGVPTINETFMATKVLQGQIDLQMQHFPRGTSGDKLDVLARKPLYDIGLGVKIKWI